MATIGNGIPTRTSRPGALTPASAASTAANHAAAPNIACVGPITTATRPLSLTELNVRGRWLWTMMLNHTLTTIGHDAEVG